MGYPVTTNAVVICGVFLTAIRSDVFIGAYFYFKFCNKTYIYFDVINKWHF